MELAWTFDTLAVTVAQIDFLDPVVAHEPDGRERGVRLELRPFATAASGTVYVSPTQTLAPALCRIDLLESAPGAADRMHWHPTMDAGEPGERVFEKAIPDDTWGWLTARLRAVDELLRQAGVADVEPHRADVEAIAEAADQIVAGAQTAMAAARQPWPHVVHDERGIGRPA